MRHDEVVVGEDVRTGILGWSFQSAMDRIADFAINKELLEGVKRAQGKDIDAKIIVWALDRKARGNDYARFSDFYLNCPSTPDEILKHHVRGNPGRIYSDKDRDNILSLKVIYANQVAPEHLSEENRLIFEYLYFAPPTGKRFHVDNARANLSGAILKMGNFAESLIVWTTDLQMAVDAMHDDNSGSPGALANVRLAVSAFVAISTSEAFFELGRFWQHDEVRDAIETAFLKRWEGPLVSFDAERYTIEREHYVKWMSLAQATGNNAGDKEFAQWLKLQRGPKAPLPPKYAEDPSDPFLQPRLSK